MKKKTHFILVLICILISTNYIYSRAGGGGGKKSSEESSSSSDHSSSNHSSSDDNSSWNDRSSSSGSGNGYQLPNWAMIAIAGAFGIYYLIDLKIKKNRNKNNNVNHKPERINSNKSVITITFMEANPGFNKDAFKRKVKTAFVAVQDAWSQQNLSKVRNWISDGIYQRFNLQFEMMKQLGQKNLLSNISIQQIKFIKAHVESAYSIITVSIQFKMDDKFISEKMPKLNESYNGDEATEYWTFVKKSGAIEKDLYQNNSCPNCGNELNKDGGEVSKCPSCSTVTYLGDYDWVLSEITQEDDYEEDSDLDINEKALESLRREEEFCIQNMEDKAANAFVHYLFASAWNKSNYFKRFATDEVITVLDTENDEPYIYNRVYLNRVTFSEYAFKGNTYHLNFSVVYSSQRVKVNGAKVKELDDDIETRWGGLTLSRNVGVKSKSKLWSHECANCGAPYNDTTSSTCSYCNEKINSPSTDWIVTAAHKE